MHKIEKLDAPGLRKFGLLTGAIVAALFGLILPWVFDRGYPYWPWGIAVVLWVPSMLFPKVLDPVYMLWMRIGMVLGWINTRIILGIAYFLIFTPVAFMLKLVGKDPMQRKLDEHTATYRNPSMNHEPRHMERPY